MPAPMPTIETHIAAAFFAGALTKAEAFEIADETGNPFSDVALTRAMDEHDLHNR